jgi:Response regulator containing CheY-like receiver domain and AraC-type DNA-binding domain
MLRALLFDDEYIVLEALSGLVDWEGMGIELAGTAGDGLTALALFKEIRPDIVLTDIRMPGKDGLQLIEEILEEAPDTCCIVFSGFNEFEYVKRAIRLGVVDYVEKPITETSIERALRQGLRQIGKREELRSLERRWEDSRKELLEKAVWELLQGGKQAVPKWMASFGAEARNVIGVTAMASNDSFELPHNPAYRAVYLRSERETLAVVFHFFELPFAHWDDFANELDSAGIALGIGDTYREIGDVILSGSEARRALKSALFLGTKGAVYSCELDNRKLRQGELTEREEAIVLSVQAGNKALLMEQVDLFLERIRSERVDAEFAEREMLKLIYLTTEAAAENRADSAANPAALSSALPHVEIRAASEQGMLPVWFRRQMESIADAGMKARERNKHAAVEKARDYIERNVSREVCLQEVAEHVGLNAAYLSVLFKEEVGETFIKYLTKCRMELAKTLLRKGLKVQEVSERIGYLTHRHFIEVFKKHTGVTPGQFKEG